MSTNDLLLSNSAASNPRNFFVKLNFSIFLSLLDQKYAYWAQFLNFFSWISPFAYLLFETSLAAIVFVVRSLGLFFNVIKLRPIFKKIFYSLHIYISYLLIWDDRKYFLGLYKFLLIAVASFIAATHSAWPHLPKTHFSYSRCCVAKF